MKNLFYFITVLFVSAVALGAKVGDDELVVGKPGSTANKTIKMGTNQIIRSNQTSQKLEFTNDGTNYKSFGSGSGGGGGVDFLQDLNGDFEGGTTGWTSSGGSFTAISSGQLAGSISGQWDPSAASQFVETALITKLAGANGRSCSANFDYNWNGASGHLTAAVLDSSNNVIATSTLTPTTSTSTLPSQIPLFDCDAATQFKIRITSTADAAAIKFDDFFIGYGKNTQQIAQSELYGTAFIAGATVTTTSATLADMTGTGVTYAVSGKVTSGLSTKYQITLANAPAGKYQIIWHHRLEIQSQTTDTICRSQIYDGSTYGDVGAQSLSRRAAGDSAHTGDDDNTISSVFSYSTNGTRTFTLQGFRVSGNGTCVVDGSNAIVSFYPLNANTAATFETSGLFVDATIGGTNPSISFSQATFTNIPNAALSLTNNGTATTTAQITCDGTESPSGNTCTGTEDIGVSFTPDTSGLYEACVDFAWNGTVNNGTVSPVFQIVETPINATTVSQSGKSRLNPNMSSTGAQGITHPLRVCGTFSFNTVSKKALRLYYLSNITGTITSSTIQAATVGSIDIHWTVKKLNQGMPSPVFTDLTNTLNSKVSSGESGVVLYAADLSDTGTCTAQGFIGGNWISSVTDNGVADCTINFAPGFFNGSTVPRCTFTNGGSETSIVSQTASAFRFSSRNSAGTATNFVLGSVICVGKK